MTTNHIDQLAEWWENAEREGVVSEGDIIIKKGRAGYDIYSAWAHEAGEYVENWKHEHSDSTTDYRILARAPKPKPAWHDADYVIASPRGGLGRLMWQVDDDRWSDGQEGFSPDDMEEVTPLIEAKVTDEMVERAIDAWVADEQRGDGYLGDAIRSILTAALGLDPA